MSEASRSGYSGVCGAVSIAILMAAILLGLGEPGEFALKVTGVLIAAGCIGLAIVAALSLLSVIVMRVVARLAGFTLPRPTFRSLQSEGFVAMCVGFSFVSMIFAWCQAFWIIDNPMRRPIAPLDSLLLLAIGSILLSACVARRFKDLLEFHVLDEKPRRIAERFTLFCATSCIVPLAGMWFYDYMR